MSSIDAAPPRDGLAATSSRSPRQRLFVAGTLVLIALLALVARVPPLANAAYSFNSDEAVNVLVVQHLLKGELTFFNWDTTYYGIVEGLLAVPFLLLGVAVPLAAKLAATVTFLLLLAFTYFLAKRFLGRFGGLVAAALLIVWSPSFLLWSVIAASSLTLTIAWGTLSFLLYGRLRTRPDTVGLILLGVTLGFGYYINELYLVYIATFAGAWVLAGLPKLAIFPEKGPLARPGFNQTLASLGLLTVGFVVGAVPKLTLFLGHSSRGWKRPSYGFASLGEMIWHVKLLVGLCGPSMVGANFRQGSDYEMAGPANVGLGVFLVALYVAIVIGACVHPMFRRSLDFRRRTGATVGLLVLLLLPVDMALFVVSKNAVNLFSNHYLLPWMTSLPVLTAAVVTWIGGRRRTLTAMLTAVLVAIPTIELIEHFQSSTESPFLGPHLELVRNAEPLYDVQRYLLARGVEGVYAYYWIAYKADALWEEHPIVSPQLGWGWLRHPSDQAAIDGVAHEAYVLHLSDGEAEAGFPGVLVAAGRKYQRKIFYPYVVYTSADRGRLLPAPSRANWLSDFSADLAARHPRRWEAGATEPIQVTVRNLGAETWFREGDRGHRGFYEITIGYRWIDSHHAVVPPPEDRLRLPSDIRPGQAAGIEMLVTAPKEPGQYSLQVSLVQEKVQWFSDVGQGSVTLPAQVVPSPDPSPRR
jgi:hypothetical protein